MTVHRDRFLITKPTRCTNFLNFFLEWNSRFFGQFIYPSSGVFHCTHSSGTCYTGLLTACMQDQDGTKFHPDPARKLSANMYDIYHWCVYSKKTPDNGQRKCPKHVEFHSKKKFQKLVQLVGFIIRIMWNILIVNCITNSCIGNTCVTWQVIDYKRPEDDTMVSKHVGVR